MPSASRSYGPDSTISKIFRIGAMHCGSYRKTGARISSTWKPNFMAASATAFVVVVLAGSSGVAKFSFSLSLSMVATFRSTSTTPVSAADPDAAVGAAGFRCLRGSAEAISVGCCDRLGTAAAAAAACAVATWSWGRRTAEAIGESGSA